MAGLQSLWTDNKSNNRITSGVAGVLGDMLADAGVAKKLYNDGWLPRMVSILQYEECRDCALEALSRFVGHNFPDICKDVSTNHFQKISQVFFDVDTDTEDSAQAVRIMAKALMPTLGSIETPKLITIFDRNKIKIKKILDRLMEKLENPLPPHSPTSTCHEIDLAIGLAYLSPDLVLSTLRYLQCFVACLRSSCMKVRAKGTRIIYDLCVGRAGRPKPNNMQQIANAWMKGYPPEIDTLIRDYGEDRCHASEGINGLTAFQEVVADRTIDLDFYKFGLAIGQAMLETDYAVFKLPFERRSSKYPFNTWLDALPHTANVLRSNAEFDKADIIEAKYLMVTGKWMAAKDLAEKASKRSPKIGFWYYAMCIPMEDADSLRTAQKGLRCPGLSLYVRHGLLYQASTRAWELALKALTGPSPSDQLWSQGLAYLGLCYQNLKTILTISPPDSVGIASLANLFVLAHILLHGPELSPNLEESKPIVEKARLITKLNDLIWAEELASAPIASQMAREIILKHLVSVSESRSAFIQHTDSCAWAEQERGDDAKQPTTEEVSKLFEGASISSSSEDPKRSKYKFFGTERQEIHLYQCSWCHNPSAVLRKCGVCGQACYCDQQCQKLHWKEHKTVCKSPEISK
ncbi:hypothetical protein SISNIDRAFT_482174 [Sistotremastrum niveocremeum HHB9708]|uniref:MYND-type domain-containing protein n=1 Tax=Sistotremastrum niveocremeum HHB9708 TaxID=1314777 RepID=A0A164YUE9_9AGAM|nr:hypothetical protein SISNIDRAFT_482174 [Sistotremastrum niveocremeum HHB9708]